MIDTNSSRSLQNIETPQYVCLDSLHRVLLEKGQMLQRGGMEYNMRSVLSEQVEQALTISNIDQDEIGRVKQCSPVEHQLEAVECRLVPVDHDELPWSKRRDLAA